jgi:hypothetical protein
LIELQLHSWVFAKVVTCNATTLWIKHCFVHYNNFQDNEKTLKTQQHASSRDCRHAYELSFCQPHCFWTKQQHAPTPVQQLLTEVMQLAHGCNTTQQTSAAAKFENHSVQMMFCQNATFFFANKVSNRMILYFTNI